jgi:hypothetical protein
LQAQGMYFEGDHIVVDEWIKYNFFFGTSLITLLSDSYCLKYFVDHAPLSVSPI